MSETAPLQTDAKAAERRARQAAKLDELSDIGLDLARALRDQVVALPPEEAQARAGEFALAYSRISKAVRLTVMLETRLFEDPPARPAEPAAVRRTEALAAHLASRETEGRRREILRESLEILVEFEAPDGREAETFERLEDLLERDDDAAFAGRPLTDWIAAICQELGIVPEWRWLAAEDWAAEEAMAWPDSPFNHLTFGADPPPQPPPQAHPPEPPA